MEFKGPKHEYLKVERASLSDSGLHGLVGEFMKHWGVQVQQWILQSSGAKLSNL